MSEALHTYINNTQRPLIGLEYIAVLVGSDDTYFKAFRCLACGVSEKTVLSRHIMKHVESVDHQLQYLVLHFPRVSGELYQTRPPMKQRTMYVYAICDAIEREYGRKRPHCLTSNEYANAPALHKQMTHFDESMGRDFMDVLRKCLYRYNSREVNGIIVVKLHADGRPLCGSRENSE